MKKTSDRDRRESVNAQAAFLVRCWREGETWRFSLESVATRQRQGFSSAHALLEGLRARLPDVGDGSTGANHRAAEGNTGS